MAKISTYEVDSTPQLSDKAIGTSVAGPPDNNTANFTLQSILNLFLPQITLQKVTDAGSSTTKTITLGGVVTDNISTAGDVLTLQAGGTKIIIDDAGSTITVNAPEFIVSGRLIGALDVFINGITIGRGGGNVLSNTVMGYNSFAANLVGNQNTAIGNLTLNANTANNNTAIGFKAMQLNGVGNTNTSIGSESLSSNLGGSENSAVGYRALWLASSAVKNNAFGRLALGNILTGSQNVGIGTNAGSLTALGAPNTESFFSVYIGNETRSSLSNSQNEIVIGYNAIGIGSNSVVLGNSSILNTILRGQTLIGTTEVGTPTYGATPKLVAADIAGGVIDLRSLNTNIVANSLLGRIQFTGKDDTSIGYTSCAIEGISSGGAGTGSGGGGILKFMTAQNGTGSSALERARITQDGTLQPGTDNSYSLGASGIRWSSVWAANGTIQTSDEREKKDIIDSDLGLDFVSKLRPVSFKWKVGKNEVTSELDELDEEGNPKTKTIVTPIEGKRTHYGLIAQEVEELLDGKDFGGFIHDKETDIKGLRYDQFIPVLINAIKELKAEIEILKAK
jgi:hypothetical protein